MTEEQVRADVKFLEGKLAARDQKYLRNLNRFLSNGQRRESIRDIYVSPTAFFNSIVDTDTGILPAINVGRSMALTLQSKLAQTKGRIFFTPVNGLWKTIKVCRNAQVYFDAFIDRDDTMDKVKKVILDALVFDMGVVWIDPDTQSTKRVRPWEFYVDPAELNYGEPKRAMLRFDEYPVGLIKDKLKPEWDITKEFETNPSRKAAVRHYWDILGKKKYLFIGPYTAEVQDIDYEEIPFALFYYSDPIKGLYSNSVMDNCYPNQRQIDSTLRRVHDALELSPANTIFVPGLVSSTNPNAQNPNQALSKMISNRVGNVVQMDMTDGQVVVSTPPAIDQQYVDMIRFFKDEAFEQEGISQISAQSKIPRNVQSGVMLDSVQDVESERFQAVLDNVILLQKTIYVKMIRCFPKGHEILPSRVNRAKVKWSEIVKEFDSFSLTSSLASVLSKDPETKMAQIEKLQAQGIINPAMAAQLLQLPDLEGAYNVATASYDNCRKVIERAIDDGKTDFAPIVNLQMLLTEVVNTFLQLDSVDEDPAILKRLQELLDAVMEQIGKKNQIQQPPLPPPVDTAPVQDAAMNGAQVTALADTVVKVRMGELSPESAKAMILAGFPNTDPALIDQMVGIVPPEPQPAEPVAPALVPAEL